MRLPIRSALLLLSLLSPTTSFVLPSPETTLSLPPANLATSKFSSWLSAFNSGNEDAIVSFHNTYYFPDNCGTCNEKDSQHFQQVLQMANITGGFELMDVEMSNATALTVLLQEKKETFITAGYGYWKIKMVVDEVGEKITQLNLFPALTPLKMIPKTDSRRAVYEKGLQPLTNHLRWKIVIAATKVLRETYIDPLEADTMIEILETSLRNGSYNHIVESEEFALVLSRDLMGLKPLGSNVFFAFHEPAPKRDKESMKKIEQLSRQWLQDRGSGIENTSFDETSIEGKNVATMKFTHLLPLKDPGVTEAVAEKMNAVADADVLILDLRDCFGMSPETAAFILSYLFEVLQPLSEIRDRFGRLQKTTSTFLLPEGEKVFGGSKPIYVLTNNHTAREAEGIAYTLQAHGRAKIIGEHKSTMGDANPFPARHPICEEEFGQGWWTFFAQSAKVVHALTNESWDGVGVISDFVSGKKVDSDVPEELRTDPLRDLAVNLERVRENPPQTRILHSWKLNQHIVWEAQEDL